MKHRVQDTSKALRIHNGDLQAATYDFRKGADEFRLIGVTHVAEPSFWTTTRASLADAEARGLEVHYEKIRRDSDDPNPKGSTRALYGSVADMLLLESQHTALVLQPGWHNTDMSASEMLEAAGAARPKVEAWLNKVSRASKATKEGSDTVLFSPGYLRFARWVVRRIVAMNFSPMHPDAQHVIQDVRSDYAMTRMLDRKASVVTVWGAGHIPRMAAWLLHNGWELTRTDFVTAIAKTPAQLVAS